VAVSALVLAVAAGSRPMFVSSAASGALADDLETGCRFSVGLRIQRSVTLLDGPGGQSVDLATGTAAVQAAVDDRGLVTDGVVTAFGGNARVATADAATGVDRVQLIARSGFEDHVTVLERGEGDGLWLPDTVAASMGIEVGDPVEIVLGSERVPIPVAATFVDLSRQRDEHWCSLDSRIDEFQGRQPPPVALLPQDELRRVLLAAGLDGASVWWEHAPRAEGWTLDEATRTIAGLRSIGESSNNAASLGGEIGPGRAGTDLIGSIDRARRTAASVDAAAGPVALGTAGVAVLVLLTAGRSWLDRRRQEVTVLAMRGAGPLSLAAKAVLEMSIPLVLGGASGLAAAWLLVRAVGPSTLIDDGAMVEAVVQVAVVLAAAVVALAAMVAGAARRVGVTSGGAASRATLLWWEPPVLALAAAALYELRSGGPTDDQAVDGLLLVFPVLLLAGGAGLGARLALTPRLSGWLVANLPVAGWLAARRLIASRLRAAAIVTGTAVAIGIVAFGGSMSASLRATTEAKALLGPGSEQLIRIADPANVPATVGADGRSTPVVRTSEQGVVRRGHTSADVLGVVPDSFADAAFWDDSFADRSLDSLLAELGPADDGGLVPVIAVGGDQPERFVLTIEGDGGLEEIDVAVVAEAEAFPGLGFRADRPLVVLDRQVLLDRGIDGLDEIWVADPEPDIEEALSAAGNPPVFVTRPSTGSITRQLQAQLWAVDYLEIVGPAAGIVTAAGLALYLAATATPRRVGTAMAKAMGLRRRTRVLATTLEVAAMTVAGWFLGVGLSWVAARLVFPQLDPLPGAAPAAIFRFGWAVVGVAALLVVAVALVATATVERRPSRQSLPEVLRDAR
jgi:putative ABC transport system permease protein